MLGAVTSTADILDEHPVEARVCELVLRQFGGVASFAGPISTVRCHEDNVVLKRRSVSPARGVCSSSTAAARFVSRCSATWSRASRPQNGWAGLVVNGCVRDVAALRAARRRDQGARHEPATERKGGSGGDRRSGRVRRGHVPTRARCSTATTTASSCSTARALSRRREHVQLRTTVTVAGTAASIDA